MTGTRTGVWRKWLLSVACTLALILLAACWLPYFIEGSVLPSILAKNNLDGYQVAVQHVGLSGCTLQLARTPEKFPIITAGNVNIDWSLRGLFKKRLDRIVVDGLQVHRYPAGTVSSPGRKSLPVPSSAEPEHQNSSPRTSSLLFAVDSVIFSNSIFFVHDDKHVRIFPFSFSAAHRENGESKNIRYDIDFDLAGQDGQASVSYAFLTGTLTGEVRGIVDLPLLVRMLQIESEKVNITGNAEFTVESEVNFSPFSIDTLRVLIRSSDLHVRNENVSLAADTETGLSLSLTGNGNRFQINGNGFTVDLPFRSVISFSSRVAVEEMNRINWQGSVNVMALPNQDIGGQFVLLKMPALLFNHEGSLEKNNISMTMSAAKHDDEKDVYAELVYETLHIRSEDFRLNSQLTWEPENRENGLTVSLVLDGEKLHVKGPGALAEVPGFSFTGRGGLADISDWNRFEFSGDLRAEDGSFAVEQHDVRIENIQLELPLEWPWGKSGKKGMIQAGHITALQADLGTVQAELIPVPTALEFVGTFHSPLLPEDTVELYGAFRVPESGGPLTELSCRAADALVALENFSSFLPALKDVSGNGLVDVSADLVFFRDRLTGQLDLGLQQERLKISGSSLLVEDVNLKLHFPELPKLRSAPEQKLTVGKISNKSFSVTQVKGVFQVESPQSFFVEKIGGHWSGGRIFTSSFRLHKDNPELEVALFCDRLELAEILSQLSLADAEGSGKVSGRIPVAYRKNEIFIDKGFLFSTPGETGRLKIKKSEQLTAGIPEDVPQFSPIHFAGAALRDFEYNWAKLLLASEEDNLVLKLQIDGKPSQPLPYRFDSKENVFVKLRDVTSGGIDQPVKLDVNFNVPLNELLRYQTTILPILRNIK